MLFGCGAGFVVGRVVVAAICIGLWVAGFTEVFAIPEYRPAGEAKRRWYRPIIHDGLKKNGCVKWFTEVPFFLPDSDAHATKMAANGMPQ